MRAGTVDEQKKTANSIASNRVSGNGMTSQRKTSSVKVAKGKPGKGKNGGAKSVTARSGEGKADARNRQSRAARFLDQFDARQLLSMYDLLPDMLFWIKNADSQIMHANRYFLEHVGAHTLEQVLGLTDFDFSPRHIARQFINDDQLVMQGQLISDRLEMNILKSGEIYWFTTSKRPLYDVAGRILGSYGVSRHLEKTSVALSGMIALDGPVNYIRAHYMTDIKLSTLAAMSHLSVSALERRFKKYLCKTPKQFINEVRLENARRLLVETTLPIAAVAAEAGFSDPSYFSRRFVKQFGELPSEFRESCN